MFDKSFEIRWNARGNGCMKNGSSLFEKFPQDIAKRRIAPAHSPLGS
jgi:hypothetical protein